MTPYELIRLMAAPLGEGATERTHCPWCHGGQSKELSFVITRQGNQAKYTCFRATCGTPLSSGVLNITGRATPGGFKKKPTAREYSESTCPLTAKNRQFIFKNYGLTTLMQNEYRLKQDESGKIVVPLYNQHGVQQGHEVKKGRIEEPGPKSITYHGESSDGMSWYLGKPEYPQPIITVPVVHEYYHDSVVLVEDVFSAMKANALMNSVALLGTNLNKEKAHSIALRNYDHVFLALDADASSKAISMARRLRGILPELRVMLLKQDIKNMEWDDIAHLFAVHYRRL